MSKASASTTTRFGVSRLATVGLAAMFALTTAALAQSPAAAPADARPLTPKDAGARYGQAVGASLVCPYIFLLPKSEALLKAYAGADLEAFTAQAQSVTLVWKKTLGCDAKADINRCRLLNEKSCSEAVKEIGVTGTVLPGLIEFRK